MSHDSINQVPNNRPQCSEVPDHIFDREWRNKKREDSREAPGNISINSNPGVDASQPPYEVNEDILDPGVITQNLRIEALDPSFSLHELLQSHDINFTLSPESHQIDIKYRSPFSWTVWKKTGVLCGAFIAALLAAYSAGAYALASEPLRAKWQVTSAEYNVGITLFVAGFGFAPMIMAPVSEAHGRYWVFVGAGAVFFLGTLGCAITSSYAGMLISRLVTGSGASIFATLVGGVVSDLFHKEDRNTPMALYTMSIMIGTGLGPLVSGVVADALGWKWIFWLQLIAIGLTTLSIFFFFDETRSNVLLNRKCASLNQLYAETRLCTTKECEQSVRHPRPIRLHFQAEQKDVPRINLAYIGRSFAFPLKLLVTEPVVFWFSAWVSFAWAILYMQFSSIGLTFRDVYRFTNTEVGAVYTAVVAGSTLSTAISIVQDPILRRLWPHRMATPEGRLHSACIQSVLLPAGLFWFGWTARRSISWAVPATAVGACTMGIFSIYLAVFNYLADTYHRYASSALAAQSMCRNLLAGIFPLVTDIMLRNLTYAGAGSLLGGIGVLLTGIPWLLSLFGQTIRARSSFARELLEGQ